ncbi:MAG TPA: HAMP domain-containing sensor histidine kinase [Pirellulales bacterium]|nr:HAMP domain-containing sensor histidine kinase [Pirellulales bacterium]
MLSRWPIRNKLIFGLGLLLVIVSTLSWTGMSAMYAYRGLVKSLRCRASELPLATSLAQKVSDLRATLSATLANPDASNQRSAHRQFSERFQAAQETLMAYNDQLAQNEEGEDEHDSIRDNRIEHETVGKIEESLVAVSRLSHDESWAWNEGVAAKLRKELDTLQGLAAELPSHLHERLHNLAGDVRSQYHAMFATSWIAGIAATLLMGLFIQLFYRWVFRPLRVLVKGSRRVAGGDFNFRIQLNSHDEMAELAEALNAMTTRFRTIRDDLDQQVKQRTKQVIRSEQLASVGFLAAGVAHEINNPLASIAMCAESLEGRVAEALDPGGAENSVILNYLRMIQTEAFRCKEITEKLLDFSRLGETQRHDTDLNVLVQGVVEMVQHLAKYKNKRLEFTPGGPMLASINAQEIKQVVLNLITNGLDSVDEGGLLKVEVELRDQEIELRFTDNGCGLSEEVREHLFEPFFTRKKSGQGTGLGLSIAYRILADHHGHIEAASDGPGRGTQFRVSLPLAGAQPSQESRHRYQAA